MNKVAFYSLIGAASLLLFALAYLGFAKARGAPMHELPVFGSLFPAPEEGEEAHASQAQASESDTGAEHASATEPTIEAHAAPPERERAPVHTAQKADLLSVFQIESPFTPDELRKLVDGWKTKNQEVEARLGSVIAKEELVQDRLETLGDREKTLERIQRELDQREQALALREQKLARAELTQEDAQAKSAQALGALFVDGEVEILAQRLASYGPKEGARILATLEPDRARELLDAVPQARWREFAEAYTRAIGERATSK